MFIELTKKWPEPPSNILIRFSEILYVEELQEGTMIITEFKIFEVKESYEEVKLLITKACEHNH